MQEDFHYYATYCAAYIAGYSHEESIAIGYANQFVDCCTVSLLEMIKGPEAAATTQLQMELMKTRMDVLGLQNIVRIWSSFHFLPYDLYADVPRRPKKYRQKYRLLCKPNGELVKDTVNMAKDKGFPAIGLAMHVLSDTWAHQHFAGIPSLVINNTTSEFYEILETDGQRKEVPIHFRHNPATEDDLKENHYTNTIYQSQENTVMNLGHGRAGHLPDYSFIRYRYVPAWGKYEMITKDNPSDYYHAFCQMVYALQFLRGTYESFETDTYAWEAVLPYQKTIKEILQQRQLHACEDWKAFGKSLSGQEVEDFDIAKYQKEYIGASKADKNQTFLGQFILAALAQKSMVTNKIYMSKNPLAGISVDYHTSGFKGMKDFKNLLAYYKGGLF